MMGLSIAHFDFDQLKNWKIEKFKAKSNRLEPHFKPTLTKYENV